MSFTSSRKASVKALDRLAQSSNAPRPHGFGGSAEGDLDLDLDPERVVMIPARKASLNRAIKQAPRAPQFRVQRLGKLRMIKRWPER
ncbi:MAG: hypothetical protein ACLP50_06695 [Solirubrobacteraceae bacterium]